MMRVLFLMLSCFVAGRTDGVSTTCTAEACLTLHLEEKRFEKASEDCINNGGKLVTMRNENELQSIKSALLAAEKFNILNSKLWIGLVLQKRHCTDFTEELHGFRWTSEPRDSKYSNWKKKPLSTCTEKRCVSISLADGLKWSDGSCRDSAFYMCKFLFKGMCKPIVLEKQGDVKYNVPFLFKPLSPNERLAMFPHGTLAEIQCGGSEDAESFVTVCDDNNGLFGWTNLESLCARNKRCKNGGCDHLCFETAGAGVSCECHEGYYLMDDKVSCALRNNCENSPCESKCVPTASGFSCACAEGFHLAEDSVSCVDIDECQQRTCSEHRCHNTPGSYFCECNPGFRLVAGKCEDVDECTELRCQQGCLNSQGSFSCYCHAGYSSSLNDSGICVDIDECISRPCEDICFNTLGSFKCSCRENLIVAKNGISCVPDPTDKPQSTPSSDHREAFITKLNQLPVTFGPTTVYPPPLTNAKTDSSKRKESFLGSSWILVCVVGSVIPLTVIIVVMSVFVVYRWKRSSKAALKNATADNYCWVSSGLDKEQGKKCNIQLND
ncbi:complement component C1q receptor-like [Sinocyclocheilus rhinocerous]|uniref:complement component C1q receptor-like n=1 Tax=Sinocyclocheilus rhinocerous TaxID=307959 RepID=UPI0007B9A8E6|nr:PREDICTED: complement component C1q receptor-like [Sinocyclocheilus rhinocerous]